jgi:hypothetical protein
MRRPIPTLGGIGIFVLAAVDVIGKAAGLYADGPGLLVGILALGRRVMSIISPEIAVMLAGIVLFGWGLFADRIKAVLGWRASAADDLSSLPEAAQNRLVTLEAWFQGHEKRLVAVTQYAEATRDIIDSLDAKVSALGELPGKLDERAAASDASLGEFRDQIAAIGETVRRNEARLARLEGLTIRAAQRDRMEKLKAELTIVDAWIKADDRTRCVEGHDRLWAIASRVEDLFEVHHVKDQMKAVAQIVEDDVFKGRAAQEDREWALLERERDALARCILELETESQARDHQATHWLLRG